MTNNDLAVLVRPLVDIKTEMPAITSDLHRQRLAEQIIMALPDLFAEKPETFSRALVKAGSSLEPQPVTKQPIYVVYAITSDQGLMPLCWHTSKQRAGEVGEALTKQDGLAFWGMFRCNHADYQAITCFPDNHQLNVKQP